MASPKKDSKAPKQKKGKRDKDNLSERADEPRTKTVPMGSSVLGLEVADTLPIGAKKQEINIEIADLEDAPTQPYVSEELQRDTATETSRKNIPDFDVAESKDPPEPAHKKKSTNRMAILLSALKSTEVEKESGRWVEPGKEGKKISPRDLWTDEFDSSKKLAPSVEVELDLEDEDDLKDDSEVSKEAKGIEPPPIPVVIEKSIDSKETEKDPHGRAEKRDDVEVLTSVQLEESVESLEPTLLEHDVALDAVATKPSASAEASIKPVTTKAGKAWFELIFDEDFLRTLPFITPALTKKEATFIEESLQPTSESKILDIGCGDGRHALELARRGYQVTGCDLALPLLIKAADDAQKQNLKVNFVHSDFRELDFDSQFDAAYCVSTSFGYFDDDTNRKTIRVINRALKEGGRFLLDVVNRDYVARNLPSRTWWEGKGCVVLEEVDFNYFASRMVSKRSVVYEDGRTVEQEISIRTYCLHELGKMLHHAGFKVLEVSGNMAHRTRFFGNLSQSLVMLTEKRVR